MARKKSKVQKSAEKAVKKTHTATIVLAILFLLIGAVVGIFVSMQLTKNDEFELRGERCVYLESAMYMKRLAGRRFRFGAMFQTKLL